MEPLVGVRLRTLLTLAVFALALASMLATPGSTHAATTWAVQIKGNAMTGFSLDPPTVSISVGDTVNWTNNAAGVHTVTSEPQQAESWDSGAMGYG